MMDAYAHLDLSQPDPVAALATLRKSCGIDRVLMVETWDGKNRGLLEQVLDQPVALCWRGEPQFPTNVLAARVKCSMLSESERLLDSLEANRQVLLVHGDAPIDSWSQALVDLAAARPSLPVYLPHLGWPAYDGRPNPGWADALAALAAQTNVFLGVSAIAHFSRQPFPHDDVNELAHCAMELFGARRVVAASDYPLLGTSSYCDSMRLAGKWIRSLWPDWSDEHALRP